MRPTWIVICVEPALLEASVYSDTVPFGTVYNIIGSSIVFEEDRKKIKKNIKNLSM